MANGQCELIVEWEIGFGLTFFLSDSPNFIQSAPIFRPWIPRRANGCWILLVCIIDLESACFEINWLFCLIFMEMWDDSVCRDRYFFGKRYNSRTSNYVFRLLELWIVMAGELVLNGGFVAELCRNREYRSANAILQKFLLTHVCLGCTVKCVILHKLFSFLKSLKIQTRCWAHEKRNFPQN